MTTMKPILLLAALVMATPALAAAPQAAGRSTPRIVTIQPSLPLGANQLPGAAIGPAAPDLTPSTPSELQSRRGTYDEGLRRRGLAEEPDSRSPVPRQSAPLDRQKAERFGSALDSDIRRGERALGRDRLGPVDRRALDEARRDNDRFQGGLGRR